MAWCTYGMMQNIYLYRNREQRTPEYLNCHIMDNHTLWNLFLFLLVSTSNVIELWHGLRGSLTCA